MSFRNGAYCTVWDVKTVSGTLTKARISTSRKNKNTGEYENDFSGWISFVGTANASQALKLRERDRIKLGDVEVTTKYDKNRNTTYTNFTVFNFEMADGFRGDDSVENPQSVSKVDVPNEAQTEDDVEDELPF